MSVAKALHCLVDGISPISTVGLKNYFNHARSTSRKSQLGRINGQFRWNYFSTETQSLVDNCGEHLDALLGTSSSSDISKAKEELLVALKSSVPEAPSRQAGKTSMCLATIQTKRPAVQKTFPLWHLTPLLEQDTSIRLTQCVRDGHAQY